MIAIAVILWLIVGLLALLVWQRRGASGVEHGAHSALAQAKGLAIRMPFALMTASFLATALPVEKLGAIVGPDSGLTGIAISSGVGGLMPGGPMTSFPIAMIIFEAGAGAPQIVAFLAGWSVFAMHRVIAYEAPLMGWRFVALRMLSCALLPILAGLLAAALLIPFSAP